MVGICQSEGVTVSPKWVGDFKTLNDPLPVLVSHSGFVVFGKVVKPNPLRQLEYSRKCPPLCLQQEPTTSSSHDCLVQPVVIQQMVLPQAGCCLTLVGVQTGKARLEGFNPSTVVPFIY